MGILKRDWDVSIRPIAACDYRSIDRTAIARNRLSITHYQLPIVTQSTVAFKLLKPFQVDAARVTRQEIVTLADKIRNSSRVSEIQQAFDRNISLCAYLLKQGYIDYHKIYFLSTSLVLSDMYRPDYLCACYHAKKGVHWYAIVCAGPQEETWNDNMQLTNTAKVGFDKLNFCTSNLEKILVSNALAESIPAENIHGLLIIGRDDDFFNNRQKQIRKRDINKNSSVKLRTYGAFLRRYDAQKNTNVLVASIERALGRFKKDA